LDVNIFEANFDEFEKKRENSYILSIGQKFKLIFFGVPGSGSAV